MFDAVLATEPTTVPDFDARLHALAVFMREPAAASLAAANKRSANILRKSAEAAPGHVDAALLHHPAEQALHRVVADTQPRVEAAIAAGQYNEAFMHLSLLRPEVDAFFDSVLVNDPDAALRGNRLALLARLRSLFTRIADLSLLPG